MGNKKEFWRYLLLPALGFAIGGAFWGWECFRITGVTGEPFANSLIFIPTTIILGVIGGSGIVFINKECKWRTVLELIVVGSILWFIFLLTPIVFFWPFMVVGSIITPLFGIIQSITGVDFVPLIVISPSIYIGQLWFAFLLIGVIMSWFYSFILKLRARPVIWRGALGGVLAAFISPVIANILPFSLFLKYIINFTLIGLFLGLFLGWGLWRAENAKEIA